MRVILLFFGFSEITPALVHGLVEPVNKEELIGEKGKKVIQYGCASVFRGLLSQEKLKFGPIIIIRKRVLIVFLANS